MIRMNTKKMTNMTTGSPIKHILAFALPLLIGNLFQQMYNMVDSVVVGRYIGKDAIAAVGACGSVNFLFFSLSAGLAIGIGIIISQYYGAGEEDKVSASIANAIYVLSTAAIIVSVLGVVLAPYVLRLLKTPDTIIADSIIYMRTTCAGIIAIALYNGVASVLRALGDSRTPLYFLILASIINVGLDLLFVLELGLGVFGVALATIISQAICAVSSIIYAYKKIPYFHLNLEQLRPNKKIITKSIRLGVPVALQNSMIAISCMALQGVVNSFGEVVMATYTITNKIEQIVNQPYSSLSMALTTYSGQNMGAGKVDRVRQGFRQAVLVVAIFSLLLIPIAYLFGHNIIGLFVKESEVEVIRMGTSALKITSLTYFALGMIYTPRAVLNGTGDTGFAMINGVTEVICRIAYSQAFRRIPILGYWSVWITTAVTWVTTGVVCLLRYFSGKWKTKRLVEDSIHNNSNQS